MADIPESSNRNIDGNPPNPYAPPNVNDITGILANLARGQIAMQETMRQFIQTIKNGASAQSGQ